MGDASPSPDPGDDIGTAPDHESPPGVPRWVKVSGIIVAVLILLVVAMMFIDRGEHGPGRHTSSGGAGGQTSPSRVTADLAHSVGDLGGHHPRGDP